MPNCEQNILHVKGFSQTSKFQGFTSNYGLRQDI